MQNFELAKKNYDAEFWSRGMLRKLLAKGRITLAEFDSIVYPGETVYHLAPTGIYHTAACQYAPTDDGATLAEIHLLNPAARPCSKCSPPALA